jgi:hypothetical protein
MKLTCYVPSLRWSYGAFLAPYFASWKEESVGISLGGCSWPVSSFVPPSTLFRLHTKEGVWSLSSSRYPAGMEHGVGPFTLATICYHLFRVSNQSSHTMNVLIVCCPPRHLQFHNQLGHHSVTSIRSSLGMYLTSSVQNYLKQARLH